MPLKLALPFMGRTSKDVVKYYNERQQAPATPPPGMDFQPDVTEIKESRPFPDPDVFEVFYDSEVDETWEGKIWKKALQQEAKMQYRVFKGKSPSAAPGEPDWEPDPNVVDLTWIDQLQKRLRECGTDLPDNSSEFTGLLEYRPDGLDTSDIPSAAIEDPLEDVETHTEDRWVPDYVGAGLGLKYEDPLNPQWTLRHSNHPLAPFPGEALKWESFVYDDGTTYEGLGRQDAPHGVGVMIFGNGTGAGFEMSDIRRGDKYEGEFQAGWAHGLGQFTSPVRGEIYIGEFFAGQRHGCGMKINMAPFWWWVERGVDPTEAYRRTADSIMRNIEFRTWYFGQELGSGSEDDTFVMQLRKEQEAHPFEWLTKKERHEAMLKKWATLKTPEDKAMQKMAEIVHRKLTTEEEDPLKAPTPKASWYNDVIAPDNYYISELVSELAEGMRPLSDHAADLDPDPMMLRLAYGSELASYLDAEEQDRVGDALFENPANSIWDKTRTLASYWLSKDQRSDIDAYIGADIYKNIVSEHHMNLKSFEQAYQNSVRQGAKDAELQQLEQTLQYYFEQGQKQDRMADRHVRQMLGEPRTHEKRWRDALATRAEKGYVWPLMGDAALKPISRTLDPLPTPPLGRDYREKLAEAAAQEDAEVLGVGSRDWLYVDEVEEAMKLPPVDKEVVPGVTQGQLDRKVAHLASLTQPDISPPDLSKVNTDPSKELNPKAKAFLEKYQKLKAEKAEGEMTDLVELYGVGEDFIYTPPIKELPMQPKGVNIPPPLDDDINYRAERPVNTPQQIDAMKRNDYSEGLLENGPPDLTEQLYNMSDLEGVEDPALFRRVAKAVAADVRRWNEAGALEAKLKGPAGEDIEGDIRFETDSDVVHLCDLNEIIGTIEEVQQVVLKARMFRWKPDGEVTLRFAQDAHGTPVQLMQDPLHYPHGTKWMAPGPLGQVHAIPDDPGLREQLRRNQHNYQYIHSLYNFDWDPAPGTVQYKIDQRIKRMQDLRLRQMGRMVDRAADQLGNPRPSGVYTEDADEDEEEAEVKLAFVPEDLQQAAGQPGRAAGEGGNGAAAAAGPWGPRGSVFASLTMAGGLGLGVDRASKAVMFAFRRAAVRPPARVRAGVRREEGRRA